LENVPIIEAFVVVVVVLELVEFVVVVVLELVEFVVVVVLEEIEELSIWTKIIS